MGLRVAVVTCDVTGGGALRAGMSAASFLLDLFTAGIYYIAWN